MKERSRQRWLNAALVVIVLGVLGVTARTFFLQCNAFDCPNVVTFIRGFGPWAPLVYAAVYVIVSPIPFLATVMSAAGGLLFGPAQGTLYAIAVATVSALVPFFLARRLGREWVVSKLRGKRLEGVYRQFNEGRGFLFVMLMRLVPIFPWEVQNYAAGLTAISPLTFLLATGLGIIPGTFAHAFIGSAALDIRSWQFLVALGLNAVMILVPVIVIYVRNYRKKKEAI